MRASLTLLAVVTFAATFVPATASAAAPSPRVVDALSGDAKAAFNEARLLFAKQDYAGARQRYQAAYELSKEPRVLYNVAVCLKEEGKYAKAIRVLQESAAQGGKAPREYVERVADTIDTLSPLVATVTVEGLATGMSLEVDKEVVVPTPQGKFLVDAGTRVVVVRKSGFAAQSFTRDFPAGERYGFAVALAPLPASLRVVTNGARDASVLLDGREVGLAPATLSVAPGAHEVVVRAPGYREVRRTVDLSSERENLLEVTLERDRRIARLRVSAGDQDTIAVDGTVVGKGVYDAQVSVGEHRVAVTRKDAEPKLLEVALRDDEVRDMRVSLEQKKSGGVPAWLWVVGGAVVVGGASTAVFFATRPTEFAGSTPGTLNPKIIPAAGSFAGGFR